MYVCYCIFISFVRKIIKSNETNFSSLTLSLLKFLETLTNQYQSYLAVESHLTVLEFRSVRCCQGFSFASPTSHSLIDVMIVLSSVHCDKTSGWVQALLGFLYTARAQFQFRTLKLCAFIRFGKTRCSVHSFLVCKPRKDPISHGLVDSFSSAACKPNCYYNH